MGKATAFEDRLAIRRLSPQEAAARKAAAELADEDVQPTLDGTFVKHAGQSEPPVEVVRAAHKPWD